MKAEQKNLKALGAALRARLTATDDMPTELQALLLRLLLSEADGTRKCSRGGAWGQAAGSLCKAK